MRISETFVDRVELLAKRLRGLSDLFDFVQSFTKEDRANDFVTGTHDIGFTFSERAPNQTRFLGRFAEERRIGIFAIEITHDGERLVEDEIAIFESGDFAAWVEQKIGRSFVFALGKLE